MGMKQGYLHESIHEIIFMQLLQYMECHAVWNVQACACDVGQRSRVYSVLNGTAC